MFRRTGFILVLTVFLPTLFYSSAVEAAFVEKVRGKQVLINNEDTDIQVGERYYLVVDGKRRAIVKISKVRGGKSIGVVTKGRAVPDASVEPVRRVRPAFDDDGEEEQQPARRRRARRSPRDPDIVAVPTTIIGGLVGFAMDSQTVTTNSRSVSMSGSGYSVKAFGDIPLSCRLGFIARGGIEQLELSGENEKTSIMYLTVDALLRYAFSEGTFVPFAAGGLGIHYPMSKNSTILDESKIAMTSVFFADVGLNYKMSEDLYLTAHVEYGYFPPSSTVNTNFIAIRAGAGWRF